MWDDRSKPSRRGYLKRSTKPIKRSWIKRKPKRDRTFKDGRTRLASKSGLRRQTHDAASGKCQHVLPNGKVCGKNAPWDGPWWRRGHLAHKRHGEGFRDDRLGESYWSCGNCHRQFHGGGKPCPKKPAIVLFVHPQDAEAVKSAAKEILGSNYDDDLIHMVGDDDLMAIERDNRTRITTMKELLGE